MNIANKSTRRRFRLSLRGLLVLITGLGCWLGYEVDWIRRRHNFLLQRDATLDAFNEATFDQDWSLPRVEIISASTNVAGFLWLFGEENLSSIDLGIVVNDEEIDLDCPMSRYDEVRTARALFPEAQIIVGIIPKSMLERKPPAEPSSASSGEELQSPQESQADGSRN